MKAIVFTACYTREDLFLEEGRCKVSSDWTTQFAEYEKCNSVGLVYVLLTEGYQGVLSNEKPWIKLDIERRIRVILEQTIKKVGTSKVQIVGHEELVPTMASLERIADNQGTPLSDFLLGKGKYLYYDSPKMIEALIRIARGHVKQDELIFRFDCDVIPNEDGIRELINCYNSMPQNMRNGYHFFSGGYFYHDPKDYLNDYAVRTHHLSDRKNNAFVLNKQLAEKWVDSMKVIGADPYNQVISGAGLCMSLKAIETLPPFANMGEPIIWIDDYLKRILHEGLGHLPSPPPIGAKDTKDTSFRRCLQANFKQDRYPNGIRQKDIDWARQTYLGRLIRGCIMDNSIKGPYSGIVQMFLEYMLRPEHSKLQKILQAPAEERLQAIIDIWSDQCYQGYPIHDFARDELINRGQEYIDQAIDNLDLYMELLRIWPTFVFLFSRIPSKDPDNAWLFRDPY